jgi:hypothetical protein
MSGFVLGQREIDQEHHHIVVSQAKEGRHAYGTPLSIGSGSSLAVACCRRAASWGWGLANRGRLRRAGVGGAACDRRRAGSYTNALLAGCVSWSWFRCRQASVRFHHVSIRSLCWCRWTQVSLFPDSDGQTPLGYPVLIRNACCKRRLFFCYMGRNCTCVAV